MSRFRLHCYAESGCSYKVALMLSLCGQEFEPLRVDFYGGETKTEHFREQVNVMGEVPVLEVDGRRLSQSGVILHHLAETFGKFNPRTAEEREEVLRWILFDNHKISANLCTLHYLRTHLERADPTIVNFLSVRADKALSILNHHLKGSPFVAAERATIADISIMGYLNYPARELGINLAVQYPHIAAWIGRLRSLPGFHGPYDLMPRAARSSAVAA